VAAVMAAAKEAVVTSAKAEEIPTRHTTRGGWAIQIGAYEDEGEAKQKLSTAKGKISQLLQKAEAYIERTVKGAKTYYRARFAGFDRDQAEAVCKRLKRQDLIGRKSSVCVPGIKTAESEPNGCRLCCASYRCRRSKTSLASLIFAAR
jgi:hypothetical protein